MPRQVKNNMEYFPHDNKMRNDRKIKALRAKYGLEGYAVYNMLLETLCEADLLIIEWNDVEIELISGDLMVDSDTLTGITEYLCKINLLKRVNGWLFCPQLDKRSEVVFKKRIRDLDSLRSGNGVNVAEIGISVADITGDVAEITDSGIKSTQSKEQYSKVKNNSNSNTGNEWKKDFNIYKKDLREAYNKVLKDEKWIRQQQRLNPGVDIELTLEKSCVNFWATEAGWKHKIKKRLNDIDWPGTFRNALTLKGNRVYQNNDGTVERKIEYL